MRGLLSYLGLGHREMIPKARQEASQKQKEADPQYLLSSLRQAGKLSVAASYANNGVLIELTPSSEGDVETNDSAVKYASDRLWELYSDERFHALRASIPTAPCARNCSPRDDRGKKAKLYVAYNFPTHLLENPEFKRELEVLFGVQL